MEKPRRRLHGTLWVMPGFAEQGARGAAGDGGVGRCAQLAAGQVAEGDEGFGTGCAGDAACPFVGEAGEAVEAGAGVGVLKEIEQRVEVEVVQLGEGEEVGGAVEVIAKQRGALLGIGDQALGIGGRGGRRRRKRRTRAGRPCHEGGEGGEGGRRVEGGDGVEMVGLSGAVLVVHGAR